MDNQPLVVQEVWEYNQVYQAQLCTMAVVVEVLYGLEAQVVLVDWVEADAEQTML